MRCEIYNPTVTLSAIIDPYDNPAGLTFMSDTSMAYWGGTYWAVCNASAEGLGEGSPNQAIWAVTSDDLETWSDPFKPFRDSDYCTNPRTDALTTGAFEWQPNLVIVGDELWCTWSAGIPAYVSKLDAPDGLWTNWRIEFDADNEIRLSSTVNGSASDGWSFSATIDGDDTFRPFPTTNPIVLSDGRVAIPVVLISSAYSTETDATAVFTRQVKRNAILFNDPADDSWSMTLIDTSDYGDYSAMEPFIVENPVGHLYVYSRNLNSTGTDEERLLVSISYDGGETFSPAKSTGMLVPAARGFAAQVSERRWILTHCDHPFHSTGGVNQSGGYGRVNAGLFVSRRGVNDFAPGVNFSGADWSVNYPQFTVGDNELVAHWSSDIGGISARTSFQMARISPIPTDDNVAYIHPRSRSRYDTEPTRPTFVEGPPAYCDLNGRHRIWSVTSQSAASGVTFAAWFRSDINGGLIMDTRTLSSDDEDNAGHTLLPGGLGFPGLNLGHGLAYPPGTIFFVAGVVDNSTQIVTVYGSANDGTLTSVSAHYRSFRFDDQPEDGDTITINGDTYTFRTSPSLTNEVEIGETIALTMSKLKIKVDPTSAMRSGYTGVVYTTSRKDYATFSVSSGSANITVIAGIPLTAGPVSYGWSALSRSALPPFNGRIYDSWLHDTALSEENIRYLYNQRAADFGYSSISGTSTDPGTALIHFDPSDIDMDEFPTPTGTAVAFCELLSETELRIKGEESASIELPYGANRITVRYKLGATPTSTDKYVIASFGTSESPARLYISGAEPTKLYLERNLVATVSNPLVYNTATVDVYTKKAVINDVEYYFTGAPRCYLGNAFPETLLSPSKYIDYDVSAMDVTKL